MADQSIIGVGKNFADLGNAISDAINAALRRGMAVDEAACVVIQVAADYGRCTYGNIYLQQLAQVVIDRGNFPLPDEAPNG